MLGEMLLPLIARQWPDLANTITNHAGNDGKQCFTSPPEFGSNAKKSTVEEMAGFLEAAGLSNGGGFNGLGMYILGGAVASFKCNRRSAVGGYPTSAKHGHW